MDERDKLTLLRMRIDEADAMVVGGSSGISTASGYMGTNNADEYPEKEVVERMKNKLLFIIDPQIDYIGLAGYVCVAYTIRDWPAADSNIRMNVLKEFTPSIDGGKALDSLISKHGLSCAR